MKKITHYIFTFMLVISTFTINAYGQDYIYNQSLKLANENVYITYKNATERLMIDILEQSTIANKDIELLKALNTINYSNVDKISELTKFYEQLKDSRLLAIKSKLQSEIELGYDHTYKNAIELQISELLKSDKIEATDIVLMKSLSKINVDNSSNANKISELQKLLKNNTLNLDSSFKSLIEGIIKKLQNELPTPPKVSELDVKTLIIGEYIVYMPSLTTDNLLCAKNTLPENGKIYYKSEFLDGQWIEMNKVSEVYHLMIDDSYKIVSDIAVLDNIEYMAQIDKEGNLIEYREFKRYMDSLDDTADKSDDELANDLQDQLGAAQTANFENSLSNMFAKSRTLESKIIALNELYEENKDDRIKDIITALSKEIENGLNKTSNDNSIKKFIDELISKGDVIEKDLALIESLESINGVPQSVKDERELRQQLEKAIEQNDKMTADSIKYMLGMEVVDNSADMQKIADDLRSQGLINIAALVQEQAFTNEEINSQKPFDDQFASLVATTVLLANKKDLAISYVKDSDILQALNNNMNKNISLIENLKDASFNTIKNQCEGLIDDKETLTKELVDLEKTRYELVDKLSKLIDSKDLNNSLDTYNKIIETDVSIEKLNEKLLSNSNIINKMSSRVNNLCKLLNIKELYDIKVILDGFKLDNRDYLLRVVDLMIERYVLIEEYKVEKNRGHIISMNKIRDEISSKDYKINYILSLKILDKAEVDIEYNIRLAKLIKDKNMEAKYIEKRNLFMQKKQDREKYAQEIIEKAKKLLNIK